MNEINAMDGLYAIDEIDAITPSAGARVYISNSQEIILLQVLPPLICGSTSTYLENWIIKLISAPQLNLGPGLGLSLATNQIALSYKTNEPPKSLAPLYI